MLPILPILVILAVILIVTGILIVILFFICNVIEFICGLMLKRKLKIKTAHKRIVIFSIVTIIGILIAIPNIYELFPHTHSWEKIDGTKSKMGTLALSLEEFSAKTKGCYPSHLNTRVSDVSKDLKLTSNDSSSVTGYRNSDTVYANNIGTTGPSLLLNKERFKNVYGDSKPVLIFSKTDPPVWDEKCMGAVYYVPIDVKGNVAKSFKIYGSGNKGLFPTALESGDMPKDN